MPWNAYTDLMPTEQDVSQNLGWALLALLKTDRTLQKGDLFVPGGPPADRQLLLPFEYRQERTPETPKIDLPDGMFREALEDLKDGNDVCFKVDLPGRPGCDCTGKRHRVRCRLGQWVLHAVVALLKEFEVRVRTPLALAPAQPGDSPLMLDDHDGLAPATVRFRIVHRIPPATATPEDGLPDPDRAFAAPSSDI